MVFTNNIAIEGSHTIGMVQKSNVLVSTCKYKDLQKSRRLSYDIFQNCYPLQDTTISFARKATVMKYV